MKHDMDNGIVAVDAYLAAIADRRGRAGLNPSGGPWNVFKARKALTQARTRMEEAKAILDHLPDLDPVEAPKAKAKAKKK